MIRVNGDEINYL